MRPFLALVLISGLMHPHIGTEFSEQLSDMFERVPLRVRHIPSRCGSKKDRGRRGGEANLQRLPQRVAIWLRHMIAGRQATYLIDALDVPELARLGELLSSGGTTKLIHYASFEREVLGRYGFTVESIVDTRNVSRRVRGTKYSGTQIRRRITAAAAGPTKLARRAGGAGRGGKYVAKLLSGGTKDGHSLRELYARELGMELDEREQAGDWSRRPLTETQVAYAALDAKVLLRLHEHFERAGAPRRDKAQT